MANFAFERFEVAQKQNAGWPCGSVKMLSIGRNGLELTVQLNEAKLGMYKVVTNGSKFLKLIPQTFIFGGRRVGQQRFFKRGKSIEEAAALAMKVVLARDDVGGGHVGPYTSLDLIPR